MSKLPLTRGLDWFKVTVSHRVRWGFTRPRDALTLECAQTDDANTMSSVTFGKLMIAAAKGNQKQTATTPDQVREANRNLMERVTPKIDEIRAEQQRALEESKPIVLR